MFGRCVLPGVLSSAPSMVMSRARPDWAVKMPGDLPAVDERADPALLLERQAVDEAADEGVQAIVDGAAPAPLDVDRRADAAVRVAAVVALALAQRIGVGDQEAVPEAAVDLHLHRLVVGVVRQEGGHAGRPPERGELRAAGVAGAERVSGVQVEALDDVLAVVGDVGHFGGEVGAQLALVGDVPRVQQAFLQIGREVEVGAVAEPRVGAGVDAGRWTGSAPRPEPGSRPTIEIPGGGMKALAALNWLFCLTGKL